MSLWKTFQDCYKKNCRHVNELSVLVDGEEPDEDVQVNL